MARLNQMAGALSPAQFQRAVGRFPRLSEKAKAVARGVLVDGQSFEEVASVYDTSRQLAHEWASKVFEVFRPSGWVTELVTLPRERMREVREMEASERKRLVEDLPPPRLTRR